MNSDLLKLGCRIRELRRSCGISQEAFANRCGLHRTYIGGVERGERNVGVLNLIEIARALKVEPSELLVGSRHSQRGGGRMPRMVDSAYLLPHQNLANFGLGSDVVGGAVDYVYDILDSIDERLSTNGGERLAELVELANLSAIIGNLFRNGIVRASGGRFAANTPHTYPDLLGRAAGCVDIEIKVALENNKPKGHLVKPGPHLTVRYVLGRKDGGFERGRQKRGNVVWIWEVRVGDLDDSHFNLSNTEGDSGKTAVINAAGMSVLAAVYCDLNRLPVIPKSKVIADFNERLREAAM